MHETTSITYRGIKLIGVPDGNKLRFEGLGFGFEFDRGTRADYMLRKIMDEMDRKMGRRYEK